MRKVLFVAVLASLGLVAGDNAPDRAAAAEDKGVKAPYAHVVIFHLKKDAPENAAQAMIEDCHGMLAKIPTVRELRVGRPAAKATDVSKKDYHVGLMILFDDYDGLKTYIDHPQHVKFVEKHLKHIDGDKLGVYDFQNQAK